MNTVVQSQDRESLLKQWLETLAAGNFSEPVAASADASFRRYFRVYDTASACNRIVMDAPPDKEDCTRFILVTELLRSAGVNAPAIIQQELSLGFLLLDDLGSLPYLDILDATNADQLYTDAIQAIVKMQQIQHRLPEYNRTRLQTEMDLFERWYLSRHLNIALTPEQQQALANIFELLIDTALEQPQAFVHRDYHSRNLMKTEQDNPGVIDYQDAVNGPVSYDLVSLLKDCYIEWPRSRVETWLQQYYRLAQLDADFATFLRWFDFMGVQRHLKVLGIFARLNYRDGKAQYLDDLPLTLKYVRQTCERYPELAPLQLILQTCVLGHPKVRRP